MKPRVGEIRIYEGHEIPVLFPGERAVSRGVPLEELVKAILEAEARGEPEATLPLSGWLVEPDPGMVAAFRRWRYRLVGQFVTAFANEMAPLGESFNALLAHVHEEAVRPAPDPLTLHHFAAQLLDGVFLRPRFWLAVVAVAAIAWWFNIGTDAGWPREGG